MHTFSSEQYWEQRYAGGGASGAGSLGRLATFKAAFINSFVEMNGIKSVIDFGCGDGSQLGLLSVTNYTGVDTSSTALNLCRKKFGDKDYAFVNYDGLLTVKMADLVLSLDIIFHLVEDTVFEKYMRDVFTFAKDYVIIYSSDINREWPDKHVRHRGVSEYVAMRFPEWIMCARIPNIYRYDPINPETTSFADFMVFGRHLRGCKFSVPAAVGSVPLMSK